MGRFLAGEDEEVVRSFRAHPASNLDSYAAAFLWLAWGLLGSLLERQNPSPESVLGYGAFLAANAVHGSLRYAQGNKSAWNLHISAAILISIAWLVDANGFLLTDDLRLWNPALVGGVLTVASLVAREASRMASTTYMTTQRMVVRRGLAPRSEITLDWRDVAEIQGGQGMLGGIFGFGRMKLSRRAPPRRGGKKDQPEGPVPMLVRGVPRFEEARRDANDLLNEVRLPVREREKRLEERRLKQSMRRLATWNPSKRT